MHNNLALKWSQYSDVLTPIIATIAYQLSSGSCYCCFCTTILFFSLSTLQAPHNEVSSRSEADSRSTPITFLSNTQKALTDFPTVRQIREWQLLSQQQLIPSAVLVQGHCMTFSAIASYLTTLSYSTMWYESCNQCYIQVPNKHHFDAL